MQRIFHQANAHLLSNLLAKVEQLHQLQKSVDECFDERLKLHVKVANYRDNILILVVDSPAWATKLRYLIPKVLKQLRQQQQWSGLQKITHYVELARVNKLQEKSPGPEKISHKSADSLRGAAKHIEHEELKTALNKLAKHADRGY